ncbi:MAG TPA: hypothetical protein VFT79_13040 [Solirubrobacterales bacterium]|nr:hypothetical protein [Solirubrobacterales bacterium]
MQAFQALSYRDKLRVRYLRRGEAPADPRMAAAAVELAEGYQRQGRAMAAWMRWSPAFLATCYGMFTILAAVDGGQPSWIFFAFVALGWAWISMSTPASRPKSMARSLEASRRVASGD